MLYIFVIAVIGLVQLHYRKHLELHTEEPKRKQFTHGDEYASWIEDYIRGRS